MVIKEEKLITDLKLSHLKNIYYFYGKEVFLVKTYTDRIVSKLVDKEYGEFNLINLGSNPDVNTLSDSVETPPMFSDKKVVLINDLDLEKSDNETVAGYIEVFSNIPDFCFIVINITGIEIDAKKAKTKKIIAAVEKYGDVCEFTPLTSTKIAELIIKKSAKQGVIISRENAKYVSELTLCNLTLASIETEKLCNYVGVGNEITKEIIDSLVVKQLDTSIYTLASSIISKKGTEAFKILNELIEQKTEPIVIMSALSGTFIDFYRAILGKNNSFPQNRIVDDFNYAKNRAFVVGKALSSVSGISIDYIRKCIKILENTDIMLKSSPSSNQVILEEAVTKLLVTK